MSDRTPAEAAAQAGLSIAVTASKIGVSRITVQRRMKSGSWPGGKFGKKWFVSQPFVDALVGAMTTSPSVDADAFAAQWMTDLQSETAGAVA